MAKADEPLPDHFNQKLLSNLEGLHYYRHRRWQMAIKKFEKALTIIPDDQPSQIYLKRCQDFLETPPPDDWDGVYRMKTK